MKKSSSAVAVLMAFTSALSVQAGEYHTDKGGDRFKVVQCKLIVDAKVYINGLCQFLPQGSGSFIIREFAFADHDVGHFAIVNVSEDRRTADGFWNKDPDWAHAETELGTLSRAPDGCWVNERATICAKG